MLGQRVHAAARALADAYDSGGRQRTGAEESTAFSGSLARSFPLFPCSHSRRTPRRQAKDDEAFETNPARRELRAVSVDLEAFGRDRRHLGVRRALLRAAYYRANAFTSLYAYRLAVLAPDSVKPGLLDHGTAYSIRPLGEDELETFSRDPSNRLPPEFVAEGLAREDICIAVLDRDELASFSWYTERPTVLEDGATVHFSARTVYAFHGYTKPAYRGQHLLGLGNASATRFFAARGREAILGLTDWANYASLSSLRRTGFKTSGVALRLGRSPHPRFWVSPGCRRYGLRLESGGRRAYAQPR